MSRVIRANVGRMDSTFRILLGLAIMGLAFFLLKGDARWYGVIGVLPILTAIMGWCPAYAAFGLSTCKSPDR